MTTTTRRKKSKIETEAKELRFGQIKASDLNVGMVEAIIDAYTCGVAFRVGTKVVEIVMDDRFDKVDGFTVQRELHADVLIDGKPLRNGFTIDDHGRGGVSCSSSCA